MDGGVLYSRSSGGGEKRHGFIALFLLSLSQDAIGFTPVRPHSITSLSVLKTEASMDPTLDFEIKPTRNELQEQEALATGTDGTTFFPLPSSPKPNTPDKWKRRLITREDPFSLHKLASISYTTTSTVLLGSAAIQALKGDFASIPASLEPVAYVFTISNIVMCTVSIRMACLYRQGELGTRNAFLGAATSSLFNGFFMLWISPFALGDIFYNIWVNRIFFAVSLGLNGFFIGDTVLNLEEVLKGRHDKKAEDYQGSAIVGTIGYILPIAFGLPFIAYAGYIASIAHDRTWFLEQCQFIDHSVTGISGMRSHIFYVQLSNSVAAAYASLFVTLRDRKLISKNKELAGIAIFAFPASVWAVYGVYHFTISLFMER